MTIAIKTFLDSFSPIIPTKEMFILSLHRLTLKVRNPNGVTKNILMKQFVYLPLIIGSRNNNRRPLTPTGAQATGNKIEKGQVIKQKDKSVPNRQTRTISPITRPTATANSKVATTKIGKTVPKVDLVVVDETPKWSNNSARLVPSD